MEPEFTIPELTDTYLAALDKNALADLLVSRTNLLLAATRGRVPDKAYILSIRNDVQRLQEAIRSKSKGNTARRSG